MLVRSHSWGLAIGHSCTANINNSHFGGLVSDVRKGEEKRSLNLINLIKAVASKGK